MNTSRSAEPRRFTMKNSAVRSARLSPIAAVCTMILPLHRATWRRWMMAAAFGCLTLEASASATVTLSADKTCLKPGEMITFTLNASGPVYSIVLYGLSWVGGWVAIKSDNSLVAYPPFSTAQTYWTTGANPAGVYTRTYSNPVSPTTSFDPVSAASFGTRTFDYSTNQSLFTGSVTCYLGAEPISDDGTTTVWQNKTTAAYTVTKTTQSWETTEPDENGNQETISSSTTTSSSHCFQTRPMPSAAGTISRRAIARCPTKVRRPRSRWTRSHRPPRRI